LDKWDRFLLFFDRSVLSKYRASPDSYKLEEDDMGGRLENMETDQSRPISWYQVRFAFRRLANGEVSVAAFGPDIHKLPQREMLIWRGYLLENPVFVQEDTAFERWVSRYLKGSWQVESGPRYKIDRQIQLIRALTEQTLGQPLMRFDEHNLVNYPVAENTEAYAKAHLELYRLLIDGLNTDVIQMLAKLLSAKLSDPSKTLNSLKEILPSGLVSTIHKPLMTCVNARNKVHGVPSQLISPFSAFDAFHRDLEAIAEALTELCKWLEGVLGADAEKCLKREQAMLWFPKFIGPPRPEFKLGEIMGAVGKTIESVKFGEEPTYPGKHQSEGIVIHFADGSAMAIVVGSNAMNLSSQFEGLNPEDVSTDLVVLWAPAIKK
jgi:hypothetical protein